MLEKAAVHRGGGRARHRLLRRRAVQLPDAADQPRRRRPRASTYVGAASEGEAVAIAAGAWLAGRGTSVMCQNSGLGNAVNPLTSLNAPFRIPTLLIVTWRGQPGLHDEPQHELMGRITHRPMLATMEVPHLPAFPTICRSARRRRLEEAGGAAMARTGLPFALVMEKGSPARTRSLD